MCAGVRAPAPRAPPNRLRLRLKVDQVPAAPPPVAEAREAQTQAHGPAEDARREPGDGWRGASPLQAGVGAEIPTSAQSHAHQGRGRRITLHEQKESTCQNYLSVTNEEK